MRTAYLSINGYKRFLRTNVNLDRNLIAFVGANEAGKSSIFEIIMKLKSEIAFEKRELTKDEEFEETDSIVKLAYFIEADELKIFNSYNSIGTPTQFYISKSVDGKIKYSLNGNVSRDLEPRQKFVALLGEITNSYTTEMDKIIVVEEVEGRLADEDDDEDEGIEAVPAK